MFRFLRRKGNDQKFDYNDKMASYSRRGTWILRSMVVVAVVLGFGVALVYAYNKGKRESNPPIITAGTGPVKMRPEDPGGMVIRDQDKEIFHREELGSQPGEVEPLIPAATVKPEPVQGVRNPSSPPESVENPEVEDTRENAVISETSPLEQETSRVAETPPSEEPVAESVVETPVSEEPQPVAATKDQAEGAVLQAAAAVQAASVRPPLLKLPSSQGYRNARVQQVASRTPPTAAAPKPPEDPVRNVRTASRLRPVPGSYIVQIASLESENAVRKNWMSLQRRYPDVLGNFSLTIQRKTMRDSQKTYYRMRAGPSMKRAVALKLCRELRQRNLGCRIVPL